MLQKLGEHIADAIARAEAAERRARVATDAVVRSDYERLGQSWRMVARSFQFAESLEKFLLDSREERDLLPPKPPEPK